MIVLIQLGMLVKPRSTQTDTGMGVQDQLYSMLYRWSKAIEGEAAAGPAGRLWLVHLGRLLQQGVCQRSVLGHNQCSATDVSHCTYHFESLHGVVRLRAQGSVPCFCTRATNGYMVTSCICALISFSTGCGA